MTNHPPLGLIDVFASTIPSLSFRPGLHVNYAETVLPMRDGLPKFKVFPQRSADQASKWPSSSYRGLPLAELINQLTSVYADDRSSHLALPNAPHSTAIFF